MSRSVLLVHGWGFDASVWDAVRVRLPEGWSVHAVDLGFLGPPAMDVPEAVDVAVGHSLGLLWLLERRPCRWGRLMSVNGFPRFTAAADYAAGVPVRLVDRMLKRLEGDAAAVVADFRARCGAAAAEATRLDVPRLAEGLRLLRDGDARPAPADVVALAGAADPIVPPEMTCGAFAAPHMVPGGGHLLPLTHPAEVAAAITEVHPVHE